MKSLIKNLLIILIFAGFSSSIIAQGVSAPVDVLNSIITSEKEAVIQTEAVDQIVAFAQSNIKYPDQLRSFAVEGKSVIKIRINEEGEIISKKIVQSLGTLFDRTILRGLDDLKQVSPVYVDGKASAYSILVPIQYQPR